MMTAPEVTIVMSPREQFSLTQRSLESLYQHTPAPFNLVCIDGGSPPGVRDYLKRESEVRGFELIRKSYYLTPNEARNLAFDRITTPYVVFVDNDVTYSPQWLEHMLDCAKETNASIVCPVICIGEPAHTIIHMAGGDARIVEEDGKRRFYETHNYLDRQVADVQHELKRCEIELAEFHCMLVRTDVWKRTGLFDEGLKSIYEHTDFCMQVRNEGGTVMLEPKSVITYSLVPDVFTWSDTAFFLARWSDNWALGSEKYFHQKWNTVFTDKVYREFVMWHRHHALPKARRAVQKVIGWNRGEWLFDTLADIMAWRVAREKRRVAV